MPWRSVAACVAMVVLLGLSVDAIAQDPAPAAQPVDPAKADEVVAKDKAAPGVTEAPAPAAKSKAPASAAKSKKSGSRSKSRRLQPDNSTSPDDPQLELATFGAGCFWHVEHTFETLPGVVSAVSGYAGGHVRFPSYEMVQAGDTGHAEVVMVQYDPEVISLRKAAQSLLVLPRPDDAQPARAGYRP